MKKKRIIFSLIVASSFTAHTQTASVMAQQLAVLRGFQQSLQKGYSLATHGLENIGYHQDGEYQQHQTYFNSLYIINPNIYSPLKQTYAQNFDNTWVKSADNSRQASDSSRSY